MSCIVRSCCRSNTYRVYCSHCAHSKWSHVYVYRYRERYCPFYAIPERSVTSCHVWYAAHVGLSICRSGNLVDSACPPFSGSSNGLICRNNDRFPAHLNFSCSSRSVSELSKQERPSVLCTSLFLPSNLSVILPQFENVWP